MCWSSLFLIQRCSSYKEYFWGPSVHKVRVSPCPQKIIPVEPRTEYFFLFFIQPESIIFYTSGSMRHCQVLLSQSHETRFPPSACQNVKQKNEINQNIYTSSFGLKIGIHIFCMKITLFANCQTADRKYWWSWLSIMQTRTIETEIQYQEFSEQHNFFFSFLLCEGQDIKLERSEMFYCITLKSWQLQLWIPVFTIAVCLYFTVSELIHVF